MTLKIGKKFRPIKTFQLQNDIFYSTEEYKLTGIDDGGHFLLYFLKPLKGCVKIFCDTQMDFFNYFTTKEDQRVEIINKVLYENQINN